MEKEYKIKVRYAQGKDLPKIYRLGREMKEFNVSGTDRFYGRGELGDLIRKSKGNIFLVIMHNDQLAGFLYTKIISRKWCMLDTIGIKKSFRKKGMATLMLEHLYVIMKKRKINYLQAVVGFENKGARNFYQQKGFQEGEKLAWVEKNL